MFMLFFSNIKLNSSLFFIIDVINVTNGFFTYILRHNLQYFLQQYLNPLNLVDKNITKLQ